MMSIHVAPLLHGIDSHSLIAEKKHPHTNVRFKILWTGVGVHYNEAGIAPTPQHVYINR